jgi:PII-like signaling protein
MLEIGADLKATIHLNRDTGAAHGFLSDEIVGLLRGAGIEGATILQAHAGFGAHRKLHTDGAVDVAGLQFPILIYFIEEQSEVEAILDEPLAIVTDGLVEAHVTTNLKNVTSSERVIS